MNSLEILSDIVVYGKYARYLPNKKRRENWNEIVTRTALMHLEKFPELSDEISLAFQYVYEKKVVPSMRTLQFAGKPMKLQPNRGFNCASVNMDDYRAFREIMFLLLGGSGVGFSVQSRHTAQLPEICPPQKEVRYVIGDSIVGWSDAIDFLMKAYLFGGPKPRYDFSDIRPVGTPLKTSGGRAPGPEPLERALFEIELILTKTPVGYKLRPIDIFDINCHIADAVVSAGSRRSATICLFDNNDEEMLSAKSAGNLVGNEHRYRANISAVLHREDSTEEDFNRVFDRLEGGNTGEPGFFWTADYDLLTNPCSEISLASKNVCNLTELDLGKVTSQEDLNKASKVASFIGTLQASYTDFYYLREDWKKTSERDALLGVSITGIASCPLLNELDFEESAQVAVEENKRVSNIIGINSAKRVTTTKPSGTASLVLRTSSGIHGWHSPFYLRRQRFNKSEPLFKYLEEALPAFVEDDVTDPTRTGILAIPVKSPEGAIYRDEGAIRLLERVRKFNTEWIKGGHIEGLNKHNVSCTVSVKPEEWTVVREWMWNNRRDYGGIAIFPYWDAAYAQQPFEEITEETYNELISLLGDIDLSGIVEEEDDTNLTAELACAGGNCEID